MKLAFIGKMRSGKDTCAEYLQSKFGGQIVKFADPLYDIQNAVYEIAGLPHNAFTKDRLLLQFIGTDWGRKTIDPDIWMKLLKKRLEKMIQKEKIKQDNYLFEDYKSGSIYVTDARFPNEVEMLKELGFIIIYIERPLESRIAAGAKNLEHASETALDNFNDYDFHIHNYGTLQKLFNDITKLIACLSMDALKM